MTTWNYRVLVRTDEKTKEKIYAIHEVYYDGVGHPDRCTENSVAPVGESLEELKEIVMKMYLRALQEPVLLYDSLEIEDK